LRRRRLLALAATLGWVVGACGDERAPTRRPAAPAATPEVINPDPDASPYVRATEVVYACGWGASGRLAGRTVHRDGLVEEWEVDPARSQVPRETGRFRARPELAFAVFQAAQQVGFLDLRLTEHDDLGCTLDLVWPGGRHRVSWRHRDTPLHVTPVLRAIAALRP
jgi:hypothetical protein